MTGATVDDGEVPYDEAGSIPIHGVRSEDEALFEQARRDIARAIAHHTPLTATGAVRFRGGGFHRVQVELPEGRFARDLPTALEEHAGEGAGEWRVVRSGPFGPGEAYVAEFEL